MNALLQRITPRERWLASIVAGIVFLLANLALVRGVVVKQAALRSELAGKNLEWSALETLSAQKELWVKRDAWLRDKQPPVGNPEMSGVEFLEQIQALAAKTGVSIINPAIGAFEKTSSYEASPITLETKSTPASLIRFLARLQNPEAFVVLESADLKIDPEDPATMHGSFRIAKWCAPRADGADGG